MAVTCSGARLGTWTVALVAALAMPGAGAAADYLLQPGDVLALTVVGAPELAARVPVEIDGTGWFPLVGALPVAGTSIGALRRQVADAYAATLLPRPADAGGAPALIEARQVSLAIEEYRPVYLTGDLVQPRTLPYRPGLTLRQALALAGGNAAPEGSPVAAQARLEAALIDLGRAYARIWSLKQALGTATPEDYQRIFVADTPAIREIASLERAMETARVTERDAEKARLDEGILRAGKRLEALEAQMTNEAQGSELDQKIASDVRDLFTRGSPLAPASRLAEVQRSALVSASRVLELEVAAENVRTELANLHARQATLEAGDQSATWTELSDALTDAEDKRAALTALRTAAAGVPEADVSATITRAGAPVAPDAAGDQPLEPGDVVRITVTPAAPGPQG